MTAGASPGPLAGVRVVEAAANVLGPYAAQMLGDMGAEVIKVEPPGGDPMRGLGPARHPGMGSHFLGFNRNKHSIVLDLKHPPALAAMVRLIGSADVFLHTMRQPAAARLGLDHASLAPDNPRLIHASASGYRIGGPRRDRPAFDDVIQGESGLAALPALQDGEPRFVPMAMVDKFCGVMLASAIGMALFHRERTGHGQQVHVPMLEAMAAFTLADHLWGGTFDDPREGLGYPRMLTPHRRPYRTLDGHICLLAVTDDQWRRLFQAIGRPELAADPRFATMGGRTGHIDALYGTLGEAMARRTTAEWRALLDAADIPNGTLNDLDGLFHDPYLRETGFFRQYTDATGTTLTGLAPPLDFSAAPAAVRLPPPLLGAHTEQVLSGLGYDANAIAGIAGTTGTTGTAGEEGE